MSKFIKTATIFALTAGALVASGCATVDGMGKDIKKTGEVISDTAKDTKDKM